MTNGLKRVTVTLTKTGDVLSGDVPKLGKPGKVQRRTFSRPQWNEDLATQFDTMAEGETVDASVVIMHPGPWRAELMGLAPLPPVPEVPGQAKSLRPEDEFVNPYTFVPTLPRDELSGTEYGDTRPPSHGMHAEGQWSGMLRLTLTTRTPLLLAEPVAKATEREPAVCKVRVDQNGRPLIHGASFKGALRSAYETVTASRYGVFFEHDEPLGFRSATQSALALVPAVVVEGADGLRYFRLCRGDDQWRRPAIPPRANSGPAKEAQPAALVPAYGDHADRLHRCGILGRGKLTDFHGQQMHANVELRQNAGQWVWRVTHLGCSEEEVRSAIAAGARTPTSSGRRPTPGPRPGPRGKDSGALTSRIVRGWLSATGYSIGNKHDERFFVETPGSDLPVEPEHLRYWQAVLNSYDEAATYSDPNDTNSRSTGRRKLERSVHVNCADNVRQLAPGTLVYLRYDFATGKAVEVHPVMIGRRLFDRSPAELLHPSLRPAPSREKLSPADRLFGWVPDGKGNRSANDGSSGYRGRLAVRSIICTTGDWTPSNFPRDGIVLAPLSSPKPTQFRFYASPDNQGRPFPPKTAKKYGYTGEGGLRGRKMYRWRNESAEYWQPDTEYEQKNPGPERDQLVREYHASEIHRANKKQLVRHLGWVREGVTFEVTLLLQGVAEPELKALLWLLGQGTQAPLRIGAGKSYGFGVVDVQIDHEHTSLWNSAGVKAGWLSLSRPKPATRAELDSLAGAFGQAAKQTSALREATESYLKASGPVDATVHYPRPSKNRTEKSYEWFVNNERTTGEGVSPGWALPHVRATEQRLPYLVKDSDSDLPGPGGKSHPAQKGQRKGQQNRGNGRGRRGSPG